MKKILPLVSLVLILIVSSCTPKVYFNPDLRQKLESANVPLTKIQYYCDKTVVLKRELAEGNTTVETGKVVFENGKYIHYIVLEPKTPGVCKSVDSNKIVTQFELGNNRYLTFGINAGNLNKYAPYQIQAVEWNNNGGKINYDGQIYFIQTSSKEAKLQVKKSALNKSKVKTRKMKGVKVE